MAKLVVHGEEARKKLITGIDILANAVKTTLGPGGRNVALGKMFGVPAVTKDGVSVAKEIEIKDPLVNMGVQMIKEAAMKTSDLAGDGTTTAVVLAQGIIHEGFKNIAAGANPMDIRNGIEKGVKVIVDALKEKAKKISSKEEIAQVARVSTNNDKELGDLIAEVIDKIGKDGVVTVEESKTFETTVDYVEGMQFDRGYVSPYFITDTEKMEAVMENPKILVTDYKLSTVQDISALAERILQQIKGQPLVIIADDIDGQALATLVYNKLRGVINVVAVKAPGFGDRRKELLGDIATMTGATYISEELGRTLDSLELTDLGSARKVIVRKEETIIVDGEGEKSQIEERLKQIKAQYDAATSDYDKEKLQERIAKLSGGVAVINVGGATEVELKERKDRVDDALNATRAAIEEGIVAGGGVALLDVRDSLDSVKDLHGDEEIGIKILEKALEAPIRQIAENAGKDGGVVVDKCGNGTGYDARQDKYVDMIEAGVIDPVKVTRLALQHAASVAMMVITTEAVVVNEPEEKKEPEAPTPGGYGGM